LKKKERKKQKPTRIKSKIKEEGRREKREKGKRKRKRNEPTVSCSSLFSILGKASTSHIKIFLVSDSLG